MYANNQNRKKRKAFFLVSIIVAVLGLGAIVMVLWNLTLPGLITAHPITYWQAVGLLVLCRVLFGSFRFGMGGNRSSLKNPVWRAKFMNMTAEERDKLRSRWQERCQ